MPRAKFIEQYWHCDSEEDFLKNLIRQPLFKNFTHIEYLPKKFKQYSIFNQEWFMFWKMFKLSGIVFDTLHILETNVC